jgi:hypothetical protein
MLQYKINSMEMRSSWEAASCAATQEFPQHFMEPKGLLQCSQEPSSLEKHISYNLFASSYYTTESSFLRDSEEI